MRGKVTHHRFQLLHHGITPAYAGKRKVLRYPAVLVKDHPRLCGEKFVHIILVCNLMGSPPPMRGKGSNRNIRKW